MKTITNNIKCLNLQFINGIANTFINCPFLVNELQVVGLSVNMPIQATNTNNEISYSTASFIGSVPSTTCTFSGFIENPSTITITGSIAGAVLTVAVVSYATISTGMMIIGTGIANNTMITSFGTGTGGNGTYNVSISQTVNSGVYTIVATGTQLTVNSVPTNPLQIGMILTGNGVSANTTITAYLTGVGSIGTYTVSISQLTNNVAITATGTTGSQLNVVSISSGPIQVGMILTGNGTNMNSVPIITSQFSGNQGGIGTYILSAPFLIATGTQFTGTLVIPVPLQELQAVIYSTLLPSDDSPIGYLVDNLIGGTESSSTCANIIYHFPQPKPIMGSYQFSMRDYTGQLVNATLDGIVFIDFRQINRKGN